MITNYLSKAVQAYRDWRYKAVLHGIFNDSRPVFTSFGKDIYASDVVNNCIDRIATEISKMNVMSVVETDDGIRSRRMTSRGCSGSVRTRCRARQIF